MNLKSNNNPDYSFFIGQPTLSQKRIGSRGVLNLKNHQDQLQKYQSIPVTRTKKDSLAIGQNLQLKSFQRQTQVLMKMYGNSGNSSNCANRKYVKSVERKIPLDKIKNTQQLIIMNQQKLQQQQQQNQSMLITQSNSKFNYQLNAQQDYARKSSGGNLNNSMLSAINIYESLQKTNGSTESLRFKPKRNLNYSSNKYQAYTISQDSYQRTQNSSRKKVSVKNLRNGRYFNFPMNQNQQPLEELRNAFNYNSNSNDNTQYFTAAPSSAIKNQNLLIQQNDASYFDGEIQPNQREMNNVNSSKQYHQTVTNLSHSAIKIKGGGSTTRRLPLKYVNDHHQSLEIEKATTDTVMYLKQQELITKSQQMFEEGKQHLINKDYKEAIKYFTSSLKINPGNKESKYYRGICYLDSDNLNKCITDLNELIRLDAYYNKTAYIVLSIAHRRDNDLNNAVKALTRGLQKFPKYVDAFLARGQLYIFLKKFDKALADFQNVIKYQPQNGSGFIGQADSYKGLGNIKAALQSYSQAVAYDSITKIQAITKRGILLYSMKNFDQALIDFNLLLDFDDKNQRAHFYKGKILKNKNQENEAILHFEQVIKNNNNNVNPTNGQPFGNNNNNNGQADEDQQLLSGNALFEIAKIRIKQKDFYEAFHNLQRAVHYDFQSLKFIQYKMFVEGVLFIMKRKVKKGVKLLTALLEGQIFNDSKDSFNISTPVTVNSNNQPKISLSNQEQKSSIINDKQQTPDINTRNINGDASNGVQLKNHLVYLIHTYRSYGHIINQQIDKALIDLNKAQKLKKLESASIYNRYIAQALLKIENKDLQATRQILREAELKFPSNKDPYKFQAICLIQQSISQVTDIDNPNKMQQLTEAKQIMDRALQKNPRDSNLLYLRGLIKFYMHSFYESLIDLDAAIDLDDEAGAKLFLARGRCHACLSMFQEAISDLTKAIEMDEELGDKNPMVHIYAGNLLMTTGSYDDATKAFTNADSVQKSALAFYQRSRCHIALANLDQALKDLNMVVERSPEDQIAFIDRECIQVLKNAINTSNQQNNNTITANGQRSKSKSKSNETNSLGIQFQQQDLSQFKKGVQTFAKLLTLQQQIEQNSYNTSSANRQHQQIIPNVKRIKIEKMRALRRKRAKDQLFNPGSKKAKKPRGRFTLEDQGDEQLKQQAASIEPFSYYKENIFGQEDFYLYKGVMNFYIRDYEKAISDFEMSIKSKQDQKEKEGNNNGDNNDTISNSSNQTDLSDVGLCSLNIHEASYNILLCLLQMKDYKQSLEKLNSLLSDCPKKYLKNLYLMRGLVNAACGKQGKSKSDLDTFRKYDPQSYEEIIVKKKPVEVYPFPLGNRICSSFPEVCLSLEQHQILTRPSFSFPFVKPPNMIPNVDENVLIHEFDLKSNSGLPKPEAPWIKRCDYGIKFTDEIQVIDDSTALYTETEEESSLMQGDQSKNNNNNNNNKRKQKETQYQQDDHDDDDDDGYDSSLSINRDNHQRHDDQSSQINERYYLRAFVKEQRQKMQKAASEQVMKNQFNFFRELDEDRMHQMDEEMIDENSDDEDEEESDVEEDSEEMKNIQDELRQHLYGQTDVGNDTQTKNIIVDEEEIENSYNNDNI